jgi:hypothetical protein
MSARVRPPWRSPWAQVALLAGAILVASMAPSCADPVHDSQVSSLGPEDPNIPQGEFHRAGQPCTWCHGPEGPAKTQFSIAGTIFWQGGTGAYINNVIGANVANVSVVDALGTVTTIQTNCVGNFYVANSAYSPAFPLLVRVFGPDGSIQNMATQISRAGSCAECHFDPPNYNTPGHIYLTSTALSANATAVQAQNTTCPVDPNLGDSASGGLPQ